MEKKKRNYLIIIVSTIIIALLIFFIITNKKSNKKIAPKNYDKVEIVMGVTLGNDYRGEMQKLYTKTTQSLYYIPFPDELGENFIGYFKGYYSGLNGDSILSQLKIVFNDEVNFVYCSPSALAGFEKKYIKYATLVNYYQSAIKYKDKNFLYKKFKSKYGKKYKKTGRLSSIQNECISGKAFEEIYIWENDSMIISLSNFKYTDQIGNKGFHVEAMFSLSNKALKKIKEKNKNF